MSPAGMGGMSMEPASPEVLAAAEQKLSADPKNPELMVEVARLKRRMGNADEAATLLKKALSVKSDLPSALFEMAVLSMHDSNDQAKAIEYFEKYLKAAPNGPKAEMARKAVETLKSEGAR